MPNKQKTNNQYHPCPECDTRLIFKVDSKIGDVIECPACGTESEIISLDPIKISPLEEEK